MSEPPCDADRAVKRERVLRILDERGAASVLLTSAAAVNWYLDGARTNVSLAADPIVAVRVDRNGDEVLVSSNERERLDAEELPPGIGVRTHEWFASSGPSADLDESVVADQLRAARAALLPAERRRYESLGVDAARIVTDALLASEPTWSERQLAAAVARGLVEEGADPLVVLVGGASRASFPHPLPTGRPLGRRALVVVCARRAGLIVDLSRWVVFGRMTEAERDADRRILDVECAVFDALAPGVPLREVLAVFERAYPQAGFPADQWMRHHQGGAAGYAGRDPRATPTVSDRVMAGQAFAWNPWVPGAKVEDTVLLGDARAAVTALTVDPRWPTADIAGRKRPLPLQR